MGQTQNIEQQIQLLSNLQLGFGIAALLFLHWRYSFSSICISRRYLTNTGERVLRKPWKRWQPTVATPDVSFLWIKSPKNKKKGTGQLVQRRHYTDNLTDDLSGRMSQEFGEPTGQMNLNMANSSEANGMIQETAANGSEATDVLDAAMMSGAEATDVLEPSMMAESEATDVLDPSMIANPVQERQHVSTPEQEGTMVLDPNMLQHSNSTFEIERSIILIQMQAIRTLRRCLRMSRRHTMY